MHQTNYIQRAAPGRNGVRGISPRATPGNDSRAAPRALRVLVADDNRDVVLTLMALLRDEGHEVRGVYSGDAALQEARDFEADVYILDIGMPKTSGYDVARTIRLRHGRAPVLIAVTAWQRPPDKLAAEVAGFDYHFGKPFPPQALLDLLRTISTSPRQH